MLALVRRRCATPRCRLTEISPVRGTIVTHRFPPDYLVFAHCLKWRQGSISIILRRAQHQWRIQDLVRVGEGALEGSISNLEETCKFWTRGPGPQSSGPILELYPKVSRTGLDKIVSCRFHYSQNNFGQCHSEFTQNTVHCERQMCDVSSEAKLLFNSENYSASLSDLFQSLREFVSSREFKPMRHKYKNSCWQSLLHAHE